MDNWYDILENMAVAIAHALFTAFSWGFTHWNGIGGAILMVLQGAYLIKKLKEK